jgi:tetrahydromethanopterin S-methyltransferase subunit C
MLHWLLCENSAAAKLLRTILQGIMGVLIAFLAFIQMVERVPSIVEAVTMFVIPTVMAILSPLMAKLGDLTACHKYPLADDCIVCDADGNEMSLEQALEECPEEPFEEDDKNG